MVASKNSMRLGLTLCALVLLSGGCSSVSPPSFQPSAEPPQIPGLPPQARQPKTPLFCLPNCSAALEKELDSWESLLTKRMPEAKPASAMGTDYSLPLGRARPKP